MLQKVEFLPIFHVFIPSSSSRLHYLLNDTLFILKIGKVEVGLHDLAKVQVCTRRQVQFLMETLIKSILQVQLEVPLENLGDGECHSEHRVDVSEGYLHLSLQEFSGAWVL